MRFFGALLAAASLSSGQTPDPNELLAQVSGVQREQAVLSRQYYFRKHFETAVLDVKGDPGKPLLTEDWETVYLGGAPYSVLKQRNGKRLAEAEAQKIKDDMRKAFERNRSYSTGGPTSLKIGAVSVNTGSLEDMIRLMKNVILREEEVGGRAAWVLQSKAPLSNGENSPRDREILSYSHVLWIDKIDRAIVRSEVNSADPLSKLGPNGRVISVYAKDPDSPWLVREVTSTSVGTMYFKKCTYLSTQRFFDYKKFDASTTITFDPQ